MTRHMHTKVRAVLENLAARCAHLQPLRSAADFLLVHLEQLLLLHDIRQQYQELGEYTLEGVGAHNFATMRVVFFGVAGACTKETAHVTKLLDLILLDENLVKLRHQARVSLLKIWRGHVISWGSVLAVVVRQDGVALARAVRKRQAIAAVQLVDAVVFDGETGWR